MTVIAFLFVNSNKVRGVRVPGNCLSLADLPALHLTSLGLPGCNGGGVLRWRGGCAISMPLLHPCCLCLYCHALCHSQGTETNRQQVSLFSRSPLCLTAHCLNMQHTFPRALNTGTSKLLIPLPCFF